MQTEKLVQMANQISAYFSAYPEDRARREVLDHINAFWAPRMRTELAEYARRGAEMHPLARWAAEQLAQRR